MKLKVEISKEELRKIEEKLNDGIEIEFHDENNIRLEYWIVMCKVITKRLFNEENIELDEVIMGESDNSSENRSVNDNSELNVEKDEDNRNSNENDNDDIVMSENNESDERNNRTNSETPENEEDNNSEENETDNNEENEEEVRSENYQILMIKLKHKKEDIDEETLEKKNEGLSLLQLCHKIRRNNQMLLEMHYYLGKRFEERLEQEINERKGKKVIQKIKMEIPVFYGVIGENPKEWTNQVEKYLSKIGIKDDRRIFEIAKTHLLGDVLQWLENEGMCIAD
ncbi:hypothetical protein RhiirA4_487506 [Rhizophagus irregularis]|uniref:Uncharacterized protein n=1 Tax=Rhizophagus irregularis TaxID=588596 RepID=A0A2I1HSL7_9GLOM|nr:hypothetical protein RhiirA4_487506 [Rhizophagus irregularis]